MEEPGRLQSMGSQRVGQDWVTSFSLSRLAIAFLPRNKHLLFSWLQFPPTVILEPPKIVSHCFHCFLTYLPWSDGARCNDLNLFTECWALSQLFHSPLSLSSRGSLVLLHFLHKGGVICISEVTDTSPSNLDSSLCFIQSRISRDVLCI